ncbi:L-aspartate oxidase [Marinobacterium sediminicola]|uniref:L-aspartate oxidase n=1 Tax=Marinobacterium sediminicola TaxID=518898 RepID=A0ABY1RZI6_9GAMM|nr:L-aspartate oxidase [Marinobacterium sediminicola]ULG69910.1 L-aspartate oxidase [Marinobacterium sediminicola]SMR74359.1 L-aspartate oxidase [Marinobacterium sediminicola]
MSSNQGTPLDYDVLVIGSGAAGLTLALQLPSHFQVAVLSKARFESGSTWMAQGGIAAVLETTDSFQEHTRDTLVAGAELSRPEAVKHIIEEGPASIQWLIEQGVPFTREGDHYHLTQEGGHSHRRIIHAADATGRAIHSTLLKRAHEASNITLLDHHVAIDLITRRKLRLPHNRCIGAYVLNKHTGHVQAFRANNVVLATGGAAKAYLYTTNSDGSTGDGIAMAWRAGCRVANMEFNQFHPTCLYHPQAKSFLISEAVRGEGGRLLLPDGTRFMPSFDDRAELAPRDIVARAIDHEMKRLGCDCVYLDISHRSADFIKEHFPTIYQGCLNYGIDITKDPIPVVPAAHYTCGGVITDNEGRTDLEGLYAIGETAFTGLHGANRLASNSLLECIVYGAASARSIAQRSTVENLDTIEVPNWDESLVTNSDEDVIISHNWDELRRFMWDYVGIVRTTKRLQRAQHRIELLLQEIAEYYSNYRVSSDLIELRNLATVAELMIRSAITRKESRGLHYTLDYPSASQERVDTILSPLNFQWPDSVR